MHSDYICDYCKNKECDEDTSWRCFNTYDLFEGIEISTEPFTTSFNKVGICEFECTHCHKTYFSIKDIPSLKYCSECGRKFIENGDDI